MGRKRIWQGKHVLFYLAGLLIIIALGGGCAATTLAPRIDTTSEAQGYLDKAEVLVASGRYSEAVKEDEKALRLFPQGFPGDQALMHMGLIWAHPENPQRDYSKSSTYFARIIHEFPQSRLRDEATALASLLSEIAGKEKEIQDLTAKARKSEKSDYSAKYDLQKAKNQIAALKEEIRKLQEEDAGLKEQIQKLKEIDMGIEGKKMQRLPKK